MVSFYWASEEREKREKINRSICRRLNGFPVSRFENDIIMYYWKFDIIWLLMTQNELLDRDRPTSCYCPENFTSASTSRQTLSLSRFTIRQYQHHPLTYRKLYIISQYKCRWLGVLMYVYVSLSCLGFRAADAWTWTIAKYDAICSNKIFYLV